MLSQISSDVILALKHEPELSIKTLKKKEIDKIMKAVETGRQTANDYYTGTIEPKVLEREEIYAAPKSHYRQKFPRLSENSDWVSRDVKTSIDQIMPSLMEVFTGSDEPVDVVARHTDGVEKAKKVEQLLKYQLDTKNDYVSFCEYVLRDSLKDNYAVAKVWWNREEERKPMQIMLAPNDFAQMAYIVEMVNQGKMDITSIKEVEGGYFNVEYDEVRVLCNHPVVEWVPPSELRFTPESGDINNCKFVAHRKIVKGDYLKRKEAEGVYVNIDKALKASGNATYTTYDKEHNKALGYKTIQLNDGDDASKDIELYECYVNVDYNNDGIYEKLIVHTVGDSNIPIKIQKNEFGRVPFFVAASERDPKAIFNENSGFVDVIEQQQDLKTAVVRQMIINIAKANHPQMAVDQANVDIDALLGNEEIIPTRGMPQNLMMPISVSPLNHATMSMIEYAQNEIEAQTGSTRYNQGLDSNSLNKMLALDTPIPMIDGSYKMNGDIKEGDILIGSDGKGTKVLKAHPIQTPREAYKITFESGDVIKAGGEHRWAVKIQDDHYRHKSKYFEKLPTSRLYEWYKKRHIITIPTVHNADFTEKELPQDPYEYGLQMGDGSLIEDAIGDSTHRIPEIYLKGSFEQRRELLYGFMDAAGGIVNHVAYYRCRDERLKDSFIELLHTFGFSPSADSKVDYSYMVRFKPTFNPFKGYHRDKYKVRRRTDEQKIVKMEKIPVEPMRCLTVEADDELYCCGKIMTVTSNTATGIATIMGAADKRLKHLARLIAECFFKPIFRFVIQLNQSFAEPEQLIRIGDKDVSISKEDLDVDYDLVLNVGQGAGTKEARINYIMLLVNSLIPALINYGIADENTVFVAAKSLTQEMGLVTLEKSLIDPKSQQFQQAQQQKQQAQMAQIQAQQQAEIVGKKALIDAKAEADIRKSKVPKPSITYDDMPIDAKAQVLANMGLATTPVALMTRETRNDGVQPGFTLEKPNGTHQDRQANGRFGGSVGNVPERPPRPRNEGTSDNGQRPEGDPDGTSGSV